MARLIILDASVVVAALAVDDAHHGAASAALVTTTDNELVVAATTRAEVLVGPSQVGGAALASARDFLDGCATVPVTPTIADRAAAIKAGHRALSVPDAIALVVADVVHADVVWTFDRRWSGVDPRVVIP